MKPSIYHEFVRNSFRRVRESVKKRMYESRSNGATGIRLLATHGIISFQKCVQIPRWIHQANANQHYHIRGNCVLHHDVVLENEMSRNDVNSKCDAQQQFRFSLHYLPPFSQLRRWANVKEILVALLDNTNANSNTYTHQALFDGSSDDDGGLVVVLMYFREFTLCDCECIFICAQRLHWRKLD